MPPVSTADSGTYRSYTKLAGSEPLPGYKLLSPLGRGGFGEVWKCEAPGGLHKAIKFVSSISEDGRGDERFDQELAAFEQIKTIRHPFLLTLERVEQIDRELVMVMELADRQLQDRFRECRTCGLPGVPREELLAYFADAAEALDVISAKFHLQHLDVKPANLFLVSGHVKVGDYGLVAQLEGADSGNRGLTPRYVAPEVLHGTPSSCSDQYSLALVYQELLTGEFPYPGRTPQQLMLQHVSGQPDLSGLPPSDQPAVKRALAKRPIDRFPSCLAFVQALMLAENSTAIPNTGMSIRRSRVDRAVAEMHAALDHDDEYPGNASSVSAQNDLTHPGLPKSRCAPPTQSFTLPKAPLTVPGVKYSGLPPLVSGTRKAPAPEPIPASTRRSSSVPTPPPRMVETPPPADEIEPGLVVLDSIQSVVPVGLLLGMTSDEHALNPQTFAEAIMHAASGGGYVPHIPGDIGRLIDGSWVCQFPSTVPTPVVPLKLSVVRERWGVSLEQPEAGLIVMRRTAGGGGFFSGKKFGFEATIVLPPAGRAVGEITATAQLFGAPDQKFARDSMDLMPKLLVDVRTQLANVQDRRKNPRIAYGAQVTVYPVHSDGGIDAAVPARCRDVSLGGLGFTTTVKLPTKYAYVVFPSVTATVGQAVLVRLIRTQSSMRESVYGAQFRTDL
ncbi:protein kinase [Gemmata sp. G18]|uniref:Protein kinase n=1 Tax=Gemmata palustris TaxID=2822762 RepID=A0ABS5BUC4_9BACT|nr:serine/threonine-protein kinase [Gemmata palustris]MBP3957333.1 protein kinase [Gemmata palustris]